MQWSETKEEVFRFESDIVVSAGAGSGKTTALVELYLRLLEGTTSIGRPLAVGEIVAVTFTDKAAVEMKRKIRRAVSERLRDGGDRTLWKERLKALPSAAISTFHSFCATLLRENPAEAGIDPAFSVLDEMGSRRELSLALDQVLEAALRKRSPEVRLLLEQFPLSSPGKGYGLREYLMELHGNRAGSGVTDAEILRLEEDWRKRAELVFSEGVKELARLVEDCRRILQGKPLKFHDQLRGLTEIHAISPISPDNEEAPLLLERMRGCVGGNWGNEKQVRDALTLCLESMEMACWQIRSAPLAHAFLILLGELEAAYSAGKDKRGALDFEDLQAKTRDLLLRDEALRQACRERFAVVMVDEFQDTNPLQKELVSLICGDGQRLFIVGDPKQSIYLFRGADVSVFGHAQAEAARHGGQNLYFQESFRSREGIIEFVNRLFKGVMQGGTEDFEVRYGDGDILKPERKDWDGTPCVELMTVTGEGNSGEKRRKEAQAVAARVYELVSGVGETTVCDRSPDDSNAFIPRRPAFGDIAILFRRFSNLKLFERELKKRRIPYYVVKGKGFYQCQEVLDLINFLRCLDFGGDPVALAALLRSPLCGVSDETLYLLARHEDGIGAWESLFSPHPLLDRIEPADQQRLAAVIRLIKRLRPLKDRLTPAELLEEVIKGSDFISTLLTTFQGGQKGANIRKLVEISRSFEKSGEGSLRAFIRQMTEMAEAAPTEAEAVISAEGENVVRLMTVHQSKGLEFPIVFIPELGAVSPPDNRGVKFDPALGFGLKRQITGKDGKPTLAFKAISELRRKKDAAETKRLFYVAITRAMDHLILSGEEPRNGNGKWRAWVDEFAAGEGAPFIRITPAPQCDAARKPDDCVTPSALFPRAAMELALKRAMAYVPPRPKQMLFSPTALEDYGGCPRKYYYKAVVGLDEGLFADLLGERKFPGKGREKRGITPLEQGDLAHRMLELLDFQGSADHIREECRKAARLHATDPSDPAIEAVISRVANFVASPLAKELAKKRLKREHPFVLQLNGSAAFHIKGTMDLVAEEEERVTVYDYKYAAVEGADLDGYRFQLMTYMLALSRGYPGKKIAGKLLFLKDGGEEAVECAFQEFEAKLLEMMEEILVRREEGDFGLVSGCDGGHCPFARRCRVTG